jgi:hypothetical protein
MALISENGTITPTGTTYVAHGNNQLYTFVARQGYEVTNVFVNGVNNLQAVSDGYYTFENVTAPQTISVITKLKTFTISATAGEYGFISPSGNVVVNYGENKVFTFTPANGYAIDKVLVNGLENAEAALNGAYVFMNVTEPGQSIHVTFKLIRFHIKSLAFGSGVIDPQGVVEIPYGEEITYQITPDNGYQISYVLVNGNNMGAISSYTFNNVDADGNIEVYFAPEIEKEEEEEPVGIDELAKGIFIYSQHNTVYIVNTNLLPVQDVSIMDMYGRVIWQGKVYDVQNAITLEIANGIYVVRVATDEKFTTTKVVIQR